MARHVLLSGVLCSGKTSVASILEAGGYKPVSAREELRALSASPLCSRQDLQEFGSEIEASTRGQWLADAALRQGRDGAALVVDAVRTLHQLRALQQALLSNALHVQLLVDEAELRARFSRRCDPIDAGSLAEALRHPIENEDAALAAAADVQIDTTALPVAVIRAAAAGDERLDQGQQ